MKNITKKLLRKSLLESENKKTELEVNRDDSKKDSSEKRTKMDYGDVVQYLDKDKNKTAPSQVGIMKSMGIEDDESGVNRSLFGKKLRQDRNDDGGLYQFTEDEIAQIRSILKIK